MEDRDDITAELAHQLFIYDETTGLLTWKRRPPSMFKSGKKHSAETIAAIWNRRFAGKLAGCSTKKGYRKVCINWFGYREHRIIWLMHYGSWPPAQIDHKDQDKANNRISNFRAAENFENHQNKKPSSLNTSGMSGVSWAKNMNAWHVYIHFKKVRYTIGHFPTLAEAKAARIAAKAKFHTFHPHESGT